MSPAAGAPAQASVETDSSKAAQRRPAALHAVWRSLAKATPAQQAALQSRERTLLLLRQLHHGNAQKKNNLTLTYTYSPVSLITDLLQCYEES